MINIHVVWGFFNRTFMLSGAFLPQLSVVVWAPEVPPGPQLGAAYFLLVAFVCSHPTFECYIIHVKCIIYNILLCH